METIAFATLLFVVYFCFGCCLLHNPKVSVAADAPIVPVIAAAKSTVTSQTHFIKSEAEFTTHPGEGLAAAIEALIEDQEPEPVQITVEEPASVAKDAAPSLPAPTTEELLQDIDLDTLQLRPARKICGKLGIQQKVNGKDAPLSWLRAQIKSRLSEKPEETAPVIEEILQAS